jgi:hypothetical protein
MLTVKNNFHMRLNPDFNSLNPNPDKAEPKIINHENTKFGKH